MNRKEYKKSMSGIHPSDQVVERIMDMTKKETKKEFKTAPVVAIVACLAVLVTGIFGGSAISAKLNPVVNDNNIITEQSANNIFTITAYAGEGENKTATVLNEDSIVLSDYNLSKRMGEDGNMEIRGHGESGFSVAGENIKSVAYSVKNGSISFIVDINKVNYLKSQNKYFEIILPYLDEYKNIKGSSRFDVFKEHFEKGEYDKYFTNVQKKSIDEYYQAEYVYNNDEEIIGIGVVTKETWETVFDNGELKDYTFENYFKTNEPFAEPYWEPDMNETDKLLKGKIDFDEIKHDTLTVTVQFEDGSNQSVSYDLGFNSNGNLVIQKL